MGALSCTSLRRLALVTRADPLEYKSVDGDFKSVAIEYCAIDGWLVSSGSLLLCLFACSLVSGDESGGFSGLDGMVDEDAKM